jgi:hypothetical protein
MITRFRSERRRDKLDAIEMSATAGRAVFSAAWP